jgi:hypothetical protein
MVEVQLQIVRKSCEQTLGFYFVAVGRLAFVKELAPNSCSALGGLKVRHY